MSTKKHNMLYNAFAAKWHGGYERKLRFCILLIKNSAMQRLRHLTGRPLGAIAFTIESSYLLHAVVKYTLGLPVVSTCVAKESGRDSTHTSEREGMLLMLIIENPPQFERSSVESWLP